jgi:hypothetical protein
MKRKVTEALLRKAEAVYPKREKVLAAIEKAHFKLSQTPDAKEPLWWTSAFDGVRIPLLSLQVQLLTTIP